MQPKVSFILATLTSFQETLKLASTVEIYYMGQLPLLAVLIVPADPILTLEQLQRHAIVIVCMILPHRLAMLVRHWVLIVQHLLDVINAICPILHGGIMDV